VHFQAQFPNELSALINRDAVPVERVSVGRRLFLACTKDPDLGARSCCFPQLGIRAHFLED
jgi:hypothetical protein